MDTHGLIEMHPLSAIEIMTRTGQKAMNEVIDRRDSDIQRFYSDAIVFVTGGSGFLGKLLVEKLLRSCDIKKIFMLMRDKKGKTKQERLDAMLADPVYDLLREKQPHFAKKLVLVDGDVGEIQLGINNHDWNTIIEEVTVIFHMAATTRFDESLRVATLINVRGTREVINLAKSCKCLRVYVHVSTAYCAATNDRIDSDVMEQFYPSPIPPSAMIQMAESMDSTRLDAITPQLIDGWPNSYTFTKALSEELIRTTAGDVPVAVVRPPIVICTAVEPTPGWLDMGCVYGATGIVLGGMLGVIRVLRVNRSVNISYAPADYVNNVTIAAGWDAVTRRREGDKDTKIYCISSTSCGFKFGMQTEVMGSAPFRKIPPSNALWYCYVVEVQNKVLHWILLWLLQYIPAYIVDAAMYVLRVQKPQGLSSFNKLYTKIHKLSSVLSHFLINEWNFQDDNVKDLYNKMSAEDKAIYNFDMRKIDWTQMLYTWCIGIRKFIIKDGLKDNEYGRRKQTIFKVLNYIFAAIYCYVFYLIVCSLYSFIKSMFFI